MAGVPWLLAAVFVGPAADTSRESLMLARWPKPTLGGLQDWADIHLFRDWRIQTNVVSGGYRLLDGWNFAHATGSEAECRRRLAQIRAERQLSSPTGKAVLVLHGMANVLHRRAGGAMREHGFDAYTVTYPSTRQTIERHADNLRKIVAELDAYEIHLVGHSMGGLVIRKYLTTDDCDLRIRRVVMLGTPNSGRRRPISLRHRNLQMIYGPAGRQLITGLTVLPAQLPPIPAAIEVESSLAAPRTAAAFGRRSPVRDKAQRRRHRRSREHQVGRGARFHFGNARHSGLPFPTRCRK